MKAIETALSEFIDMFDPEASTIYIQLSRDEVRRLRDETSYGLIPPTVMLTPDQRNYLYNLLFNSATTEWDLGLIDDPTQ